MLVGRSEQEEYQQWDQKNAQMRRESWKHYQAARKFLNFFLVNMKSDVMASIFMFTKNVREQKDDGLKMLRFLIKKYNIFLVIFTVFLEWKISIVVTWWFQSFLTYYEIWCDGIKIDAQWKV